MIIIEGLDATGKSTLAERISLITTWPIQKSEGPEKFPGEILDRCDRYRCLPKEIIFDRHPVISQSVYAKFSGKTPISPHYLILLKARNPLIIYASGENKGHHQIKEYDDAEHLKMIETKRSDLEEEYLCILREHFPGFMVYKWQFFDAIVEAAEKYAKGEKA